jgi:hypothetical protein
VTNIRETGRGITMPKISIVYLSMAFLFACVTTPPQGHNGMKRITEIPGVREVAFQSAEKRMSVVVMGFGYICPAVTDVYPVNINDNELYTVVTCFDGKTSSNYRFVQSKDGKWCSVSPTNERPSDLSIEHKYQIIISMHGFKCSKVTEMQTIRPGKILQMTCEEGKYKVDVVNEMEGMLTVTPW